MSRLMRRSGMWLLIGPTGLIVATYPEYVQASYHLITGRLAPAPEACRKLLKAAGKQPSK